MDFTGARRGLVCAEILYDKYVLWSPATRQFRILPPLR